jgi:hypothetical protein
MKDDPRRKKDPLDWLLSPGEVVVLHIEHDPWCSRLTGGVCCCDPDLWLEPVPPRTEGADHE